ncbi:uncharacterized protein C19orf44-like [Dendronephthya gigantea]|uniref:uncharacterized protein C19orf44-like n=1 Tax=Dendronephthya gigantea TaxID=151771 RepID=UPI0010694438|nr:uncharacterized protein C19orf44-like [Dendronephthya gigantea]
MSTKAKWRASFQKTRSISQTSLSNSLTVKSSLMDEDDLSFSDNELEQYLGKMKEKSGVNRLNRLWTGNTFDRVIDRTPDVSISSVSDGEAPIDEEADKNEASDNDFLPNIMALPSVATEENKTEVSEPSSIRPFQAVNLMPDLELSDAPQKLTKNVKMTLSQDESEEVIDRYVRSTGKDLSSADSEEVHTLDEITEEIEEDLSQGSKQDTISSNLKRNNESRQQKDSPKSERVVYDETDQSLHKTSSKSGHSKTRSDSRHSKSKSKKKTKRSSQQTSEHSYSSLDSRKEKRTSSSRSKSDSRGHGTSKKSEDSYTTDFSDSASLSSKINETDSYTQSGLGKNSVVLSSKVTSVAEISKTTSKHKINACSHDVATQVNMDDVGGPKLAVGMATLGPSLGHRYVDPSPIARHAVDADAVEAVTAYNPAVIALTDMLRQQLSLVQQFVDNSRRMYESYTRNLDTTYRYTTLEDTLQYIDENRNRPDET